MRKTVVTIGTVAVVTLTSTFTTTPGTVLAEQNVSNLKTEQSKLNSDLSKVEKKIKEILLEMQEIHEEIIKLEEEIKANKKVIKDVEKQMDEHEKEINQINERIKERNEILKNRISSFQQAGGNIHLLEVVFGAKSPLDFISRVEAVTTMTSADQELIAEQEADRAEAQAKVDELEQIKADYEGIIDEIEYSLKEQEKSKKKMAKKEKELKKEKNKIEGNLQSVNSELARLESQIRADMRAETSPVRAETSPVTVEKTSNNKINVDTSSVIATARSASGVPYKLPGDNLSGFDCSGFVTWVYNQHGVSLPRTAAAMANVGQSVPSLSQAQPGDLVIFRNGGHVGIYVGGGKFIGSQSSTGVAVADMTEGYWAKNFDGIIRRVK